MTIRDDQPEGPGPSPTIGATGLLRSRAVWITPVILASVLLFLMTLIYIGSVVDPSSHLHGLPVLVVNEDAGATAQSQSVDIGQQVVSALDHAAPVTSRLSLHSVTPAQAEARMNKGAAFAAIVIPRDFTRATLAVYGEAPRAETGLPTIQLLTNGRAGSIGVSLATAVTEPALTAIAKVIGGHLSAASAAGGTTNAALDALRADPVVVTPVPYRPVPDHSALGLSAFYVSLLTIMCGFLGGTIVNSTLDAALGYATNEIGPRWRQRAPARISRWQTLLAKWLMAAVLAPILAGLMLLVAVAILHMDSPDVWYLWLFTSFAAVVVAIGTLVFFAALGSLGQLLAMLVFVYLALASSGGTIPLQALPGVLRFAAGFEPLRQILGGVKSILYFKSAGDAGLTRGFVLTGIGLAVWLVLGIAVTVFYDRKGLYRIQPEVLEYVQGSVHDYRAGQPEEDAVTTPD